MEKEFEGDWDEAREEPSEDDAPARRSMLKKSSKAGWTGKLAKGLGSTIMARRMSCGLGVVGCLRQERDERSVLSPPGLSVGTLTKPPALCSKFNQICYHTGKLGLFFGKITAISG